MYAEIKKRKKAEKKLEDNANKDPLTNIYNRRKLSRIFEIEKLRASRYKHDLSLIFIDIDNFKVVNDTYGHDLGDKVLIKFSEILKKNIRKTDYLSRWGGEEFIILLTETNASHAALLAEKLKDIIAESPFSHKKRITASFGVSQYLYDDQEKDVFKRADNAMYYVKEHGKNAVKIL
ncbi:MAG: GGDEF domain-containing protein [Campylobacteraceae bacterium]|nr:GGDEF domain-containing protein [Campylobacteraceae bacterium]